MGSYDKSLVKRFEERCSSLGSSTNPQPWAGGPTVSIVQCNALAEENSTTTLPTLAMAGLVLFFVPRGRRFLFQLGKLIRSSVLGRPTPSVSEVVDIVSQASS